MDMCYDGALVMPSNYAVMEEEEMTYVEGGEAVTTAISFAILAAGANYGACYKVGVRMSYRFSKKQYKKVKWPIRVACVAAMGAIPAGIAICGFENGFYSKAK